MYRAITVSTLAALILGTVSCSRGETVSGALEAPSTSTTEVDPATFRRTEYQRARAAARAWLDALDVDPVELSRHGVKGKKKLAEILDCYLALLNHSNDPVDRRALRARIEGLSQHASRRDYHDMAQVSDREFTENSMSYLRVAWLLKGFGADTSRYREEILKIQPRLDAHLLRRGPWQQATFVDYYDRLGLKIPLGVSKAPLQTGLVARRHPANRYSVNDVYDLTHEVFVAFDYGNRRRQTTFGAIDVEYIRAILPILMGRFTASRDPDLVGELISCLTYFGWQNTSAHRQAVDFLLESQNANGSWGSYEAYRPQFGKYLDHHAYLHTTMVVLQSLLETYDRRESRPEGPVR